MSQLSFWGPGEGEPIHVRDTVIGPASARDVDSFCIRFHYTRTGGNRMWRWGLWHRASLLGVVSYNLPPKDACYGVFGADLLGNKRERRERRALLRYPVLPYPKAAA